MKKYHVYTWIDIKEKLLEKSDYNRTIHSMADAMGKMRLMIPVEYEYHKKKKKYQRQCGIHMDDKDEVAKAIPDNFLNKNGESFFISGDYITNLMMQCIREQDDRITYLEQELLKMKKWEIRKNYMINSNYIIVNK